MNVHFSSKTDQWSTPQDTFDALAAEFGPFDLDVCATPENAKCARFYTREDDGLAQPWAPARCWMNPPICTCNVHPMVLCLEHENKEMPTLLEDIATHGRVLVVANGQGEEVRFLVVQGMQSAVGEKETGREASRSPIQTASNAGKACVLTEPEGSRKQAQAKPSRQPHSQAKAPCCSLRLERETVETLSGIVGEQVRVLWEGSCLDAGSFCSAIAPGLSGHNSLQHGSSVLLVQSEKRGTASGRVVGVGAVCPHCGKAGILSVTPPRVFMNPPYGRTIGAWMAKAWKESQRGALVVCLVPARTDTAWWHDYAANGRVRFLRGRLKFGGAANSAPFPSAIVVFAHKKARRSEDGLA